jgi:hypothetical protein
VPDDASEVAAKVMMTPPELAAFLGVRVRTLADWRRKGEGPPFIPISHNVVRYLLEDVLAWARQLRATSSTAARFGPARRT